MRPAEPTSGGLLFIPVSGGGGSGELQRARLLARAARARWPRAPIAICGEAQALSALPADAFETLPLPASPTRCTVAVRALIAARRPALVVFDSTARPAQLAAARDAGAGIVYLSSRPSARGRGFRPGAFTRIDEHWSVEFDPAGRLPNLWQRACLRWRPALRWRPLGALAEPADSAQLPAPVRAHLARGASALWCPGGGGGRIEALDAPAAFAAAAERAGVRAIVVRADRPAGSTDAQGELMVCGPLPNAALMALLPRVEFAVLGAGSLLLQALAAGTACAAVALASDQPARLRQLAAAGAVRTCEPAIDTLARAATALAGDRAGRACLRERAAALGLRNGLPAALDAMARWLG